MQFKHPDFLYALLALIIPILVHLFQLRKFKKVAFSNVQFLQSVTLQTRKSSKIKKWLTLLTRLLLLACVIIAFAQPYFSAKENSSKQTETAIYLDNSFSMQAKGQKGPLLQRAIQELLAAIDDDEQISIITNNESYRKVSKKDIQNDLLQLDYSANQLPYSAAYLKAKQLLSTDSKTNKRVIMISDFQQKEESLSIPTTTDTQTNLVQLQPVTHQNLSIDSLYVNYDTNNELQLHVELSSSDNAVDNVPVAVYNEEQLLAKTTVSIPEKAKNTVTFRLEENTKINGRVLIEDPTISFDNFRYFNINTPEKIKVIAINESDDKFLKSIYTPDEFTLISSLLQDVNYNNLQDANLIILNEVKQIPVSLIDVLQSFYKQGGTLCFIPATDGNIPSYQQLTSQLGVTGLTAKKTQEKQITTIAFSHPLYNGVFDNTVRNFQYPKVNSLYTTNASNTILAYEDKSPFLYTSGNFYAFTAAINTENSNFKNSPLIVPTLYNIGKQSLQLSDISYTIGQNNSYDVAIKLGQDGILSLVNEEENIIPQQHSFSTKVRITTNEIPTKAGIYSLQNKENIIQHISYNYDTSESDLQYYRLTTNDQYEVSDAVSSLFNQIKEDSRVNELWKWFIIFALLFLIIEILLLKYLK